MRHLSFGLLAVGLLLPGAAQAQNYIASRNYSGPGVIVNMDVALGGGQMPLSQPMPGLIPSMPAPMAPMPVLSTNLPPIDGSKPLQLGKPMIALDKPAMPSPHMPSGALPERMPAPMQMASATPAPALGIDRRQVPGMIPVHPVTPPPGADLSATINELLRPAAAGAPVPPVKYNLPSATNLPGSVGAPSQQPEIKTAMLAPPPSLPKPAESLNAPQAVQPMDDFEAYRLLFDTNSDNLKDSEKAVLNKIVGKMNADPALRLNMQSYANGTPDTTAQARRLSLTRALKVRSYLMEKGIAATRLDVRAMGMGSTAMGDKVSQNKAPADRVDVIFARG